MTTVKEAWGLCCPDCDDDSGISITATTDVRLLPNGTEETGEGGFEWDRDCMAKCRCGFKALVRNFEIEQ